MLTTKYETGHGSPAVFAVAGILFLTVALLYPIIEEKVPWVDAVFFIIEGILSVVVAFDYFHLYKKAVPLTYLLLTLFQFFMAFRKSKKGIQHYQLQSKL